MKILDSSWEEIVCSKTDCKRAQKWFTWGKSRFLQCWADNTPPFTSSSFPRYTLSDWAMHSQQNNIPSRWQVGLQPALRHGKIKATLLASDFHILHVVKTREVPRYGWCSGCFLPMVSFLGDAKRSSHAAEADGSEGCSPSCRICL